MSELLEKKVAKIAVQGLYDTMKAIVDGCADEATDKAFDELKKLIPGQVDDAILDLIKPTVKPYIKAELLKAVEEILKLMPKEDAP